MWFPPSYVGKRVRAWVYIAALDTCGTLRAPVRISVYNGEIEGCPHSGPSLAVTQAGIQAVWFTAGPGSNSHPLMQSSSAAGIYQTILPLAGKTPEEQAACIAAAPSRALMKGKQGFRDRKSTRLNSSH